MSTLKVTNIQATGETASRAVSGVAAAYIKRSQADPVSSADWHNSFNMSSVVDEDTGTDRVFFSNTFSAADYLCVGSINSGTNNNLTFRTGSLYTTSGVELKNSDADSGSVLDYTYSALFHGDLA